MRNEPPVKRAVAFVDGQNLFHSARAAYGYTYPNYDVAALAALVCAAKAWHLHQVRFYTGVPAPAHDELWSGFWAAKLLRMSRQGIHTFTRPVRYRDQVVDLADGSQQTVLAAEEMDIDTRIALDVIRMARRQEYDVAVIFSQDQSLSDVAAEVRAIAREQDRWIKVACALPRSTAARKRRGINSTDWIHIDRALYDACLDPHDYRPKKK